VPIPPPRTTVEHRGFELPIPALARPCARREVGSLPPAVPSLAEANRVDGRQVGGHGLPAVAAVVADVEVAGGAAEGERVAAVPEGVPVDDVVGVLLRQALAEIFPALAAVLRAGDEEAAVDGHAAIVGLAGDEP